MRMMSDQPARHFAAETPILAWNKHYSKAEYQRLTNFGGNFGWKDIKEMSKSACFGIVLAQTTVMIVDSVLFYARCSTLSTISQCRLGPRLVQGKLRYVKGFLIPFVLGHITLIPTHCV